MEKRIAQKSAAKENHEAPTPELEQALQRIIERKGKRRAELIQKNGSESIQDSPVDVFSCSPYENILDFNRRQSNKKNWH